VQAIPAALQDAATVSDLLYSLKRKGIRVWLQDGQLQYEAADGMLTHDDTVWLGLLKERLTRKSGSRQVGRHPGQQLTGRPAEAPIPLTFTQMAHWLLYSLERHRSISALTSATHLTGPLNLHALDAALATLLRRHEALRTQIVVRDGVPMQEVRAEGPAGHQFVDLTAFPSELRMARAKETTEALILESIDLANDPLFRVWLLKLDVDEHVLVVSTDHIISDAWSMSVVLRDIFAAYRQFVRADTAAMLLPAIPIQQADFAVWQRETEMQWQGKHQGYWERHLRNAGHLKFNNYHQIGPPGIGWGRVPLNIDSQMTQSLSAWCKSRKTTVAMAVFTAWCALLLRWCEVSDAVVQYQINGRESWKVRDTVGYFACKLFLRVQLSADMTFADLLAQVESERLTAYAHADFSRLEARRPALPFAGNSLFNWVPSVLEDDLSRLARAAGFRSCRPLPFDYRALETLDMDHEPSFLAFEHSGGIRTEIQFKRSRAREDAIVAFGDNLICFIRSMLADSRTRICAVPIVRRIQEGNVAL
jgi:hypothetical protein